MQNPNRPKNEEAKRQEIIKCIAEDRVDELKKLIENEDELLRESERNGKSLARRLGSLCNKFFSRNKSRQQREASQSQEALKVPTYREIMLDPNGAWEFAENQRPHSSVFNAVHAMRRIILIHHHSTDGKNVIYYSEFAKNIPKTFEINNNDGSTATIRGANLGGLVALMSPNNSKQFIDLFREIGGNMTESTKCGASPLHLAALSKNDNALTEILKPEGNSKMKFQCNPESTGEDGITPLMLAALSGNRNGFARLLENGASIHTKDKHGCTIGHYLAAGADNLELISDLVRNKQDEARGELVSEDFEIADEKGITGLQRLLVWANEECTENNNGPRNATDKFELIIELKTHEQNEKRSVFMEYISKNKVHTIMSIIITLIAIISGIAGATVHERIEEFILNGKTWIKVLCIAVFAIFVIISLTSDILFAYKMITKYKLKRKLDKADKIKSTNENSGLSVLCKKRVLPEPQRNTSMQDYADDAHEITGVGGYNCTDGRAEHNADSPDIEVLVRSKKPEEVKRPNTLGINEVGQNTRKKHETRRWSIQDCNDQDITANKMLSIPKISSLVNDQSLAQTPGIKRCLLGDTLVLPLAMATIHEELSPKEVRQHQNQECRHQQNQECTNTRSVY